MKLLPKQQEKLGLFVVGGLLYTMWEGEQRQKHVLPVKEVSPPTSQKLGLFVVGGLLYTMWEGEQRQKHVLPVKEVSSSHLPPSFCFFSYVILIPYSIKTIIFQLKV